MKRKSLDVQKEIFKAIRENTGITLTELERKIGTNPRSLWEHCEQLEFLKLIKIKRTDKTTQLFPV